MTEAVEQLKSQVINLSAAERADLAYFLLSSLEPEEEGAEDAWRKEVARRVTEIRSGQAVGRPIEEVLAELRRHYPSLADGETHQEGCTHIQYFSSPAVPLLPGTPFEPRRGRPSRSGAEQQHVSAVEAEPQQLTEAQKQDLQHRVAAYEANPQAGSTWEQVKARLQQRE